MNYSKAVKRSLCDPHEIINSSAETEVGRKLTKAEWTLLTKKFSLRTIADSIEQVKHFCLFETALTSNFFSMVLELSNSCFYSQESQSTTASFLQTQHPGMVTASFMVNFHCPK